MYACVHARVRLCLCVRANSNPGATGWRRPIGCFIFIGYFLQKSPAIRGSFAKRDLQRNISNASPSLQWRCRSTFTANIFTYVCVTTELTFENCLQRLGPTANFRTYVQSLVTVYQVCCSVLQCFAVCCIVSQCVVVCCSVVQSLVTVYQVRRSFLQCVAMRCSAVQCVCVAVCRSVLQSLTVYQVFCGKQRTGAQN